MYDSIREVVATAVAGSAAAPYASQYASVIDKVAADVATHVSKCGEDTIARLVGDDDLDEDATRALFVETGLAVEREPEVVAAAPSGDMDARMSAMERKIDALVRLAEQHLGSVDV